MEPWTRGGHDEQALLSRFAAASEPESLSPGRGALGDNTQEKSSGVVRAGMRAAEIMKPEKLTLGGFVTFIATIAVFLSFGPEVGFRFVGILGVVGAVQALRTGRLGVSIDGYEPSFYLTGRVALVANALILLIFIILVAKPSLFVGLAS